jgi:hypothetical protein
VQLTLNQWVQGSSPRAPTNHSPFRRDFQGPRQIPPKWRLSLGRLGLSIWPSCGGERSGRSVSASKNCFSWETETDLTETGYRFPETTLAERVLRREVRTSRRHTRASPVPSHQTRASLEPAPAVRGPSARGCRLVPAQTCIVIAQRRRGESTAELGCCWYRRDIAARAPLLLVVHIDR